MSLWTMCSLSHGVHDCSRVASMALPFVSRKSDADWHALHLFELFTQCSSKACLDISVSVYLSYSLVLSICLEAPDYGKLHKLQGFMSESQIVKSKCTMVDIGSQSVKFGFLLKP